MWNLISITSITTNELNTWKMLFLHRPSESLPTRTPKKWQGFKHFHGLNRYNASPDLYINLMKLGAMPSTFIRHVPDPGPNTKSRIANSFWFWLPESWTGCRNRNRRRRSWIPRRRLGYDSGLRFRKIEPKNNSLPSLLVEIVTQLPPVKWNRCHPRRGRKIWMKEASHLQKLGWDYFLV